MSCISSALSGIQFTMAGNVQLHGFLHFLEKYLFSTNDMGKGAYFWLVFLLLSFCTSTSSTLFDSNQAGPKGVGFRHPSPLAQAGISPLPAAKSSKSPHSKICFVWMNLYWAWPFCFCLFFEIDTDIFSRQKKSIEKLENAFSNPPMGKIDG